MPLQYVLANLLAESPDAISVLLLDDTGEMVEMACSVYRPFDMKVLGAYLGIYLRQIDAIVGGADMGTARLFHIERDRLHFHVSALPQGYFLALVQRRPSLVVEGRRLLEVAAAHLRREVFDD